MSNDTQQLEKQNPTRLWLERHLGKVILTSIPVVLTMLAGWIYTIGAEIAVIKEKVKEDEAQWSALLSQNEKVKDLQIEVELYKRLFYLTVEKGVDPETFHLERAFPKRTIEESMAAEEPVAREERVEDYRQEQIQQMQKR